MLKKYTNCFVEMRNGKVIATMKAKYKNPTTLDEARAEGSREAKEKGYLTYLGVLNVDVTSAHMKKLLKSG